VTTIRASNKLHLWILTVENCKSDGCSTGRQRRGSTAKLAGQGVKVRVGMEASGHACWFERLLAELNIELWIGDAAEIRTRRVRKQKTDRQDAQLILKLMLKDDFPQISVPSWENRDLRQLLWHPHRMVQARTRVMNQLQAVALNEGLRCKKRLWREAEREQLEAFPLAP
jgi:transposase